VHTNGTIQRRRRHSSEFKAEAIAACRQPGVSIAAVAMSRGLNANLLRRWMVEAEGAQAAAPSIRKPLPGTAETFIALPAPRSADGEPIQIEIRRGAVTVSIRWPSSAMHECASWLREVLK